MASGSFRRSLQALRLLALFVQVLRPFEQQPARSFQHILRLLLRLALKLAPQIRELVVEQLHQMERIVHDLRLRQVSPDRQRVGRRKIYSHGFDPRPRALQPAPERVERLRSLPLTHEHHRPLFQVQHDRQAALPLAQRDLIDGQQPQMRQLRTPKPSLQISLLEILDHVPAHTQMLSRVLNRRQPRHLQGVTLEPLRQPPLPFGERHLHLPHHPAPGALHPRHPEVDPHRPSPTGTPRNFLHRPPRRTTSRFPHPAHRRCFRSCSIVKWIPPSRYSVRTYR